MTPSHIDDAGYSPDMSATLTLHGEQFAIAALGDGEMVLRSPRLMEAGRGVIRMMVGSRETIYHIDLWMGIDPTQPEQCFHLLAVSEGAAA